MRTAWRWIAAAWGALAVGTAMAAPAVPVYREFKDWIVGCDNVRACTAKSAPEKEGEATATLEIWRESGGTGELQATLWLTADFDPAQMRLDGKALALKAAWAGKADGESHGLKQDDALRFVRAIANGRVLQLTADAKGPSVPLDGLAAALLFVDDVQGRVGNSTALGKPGGGGAGAVPNGPTAPVVRAAPTPPPLADAAALAKAVRAAQQPLLKQRCDPQLKDFDGDEADPLTADEALVLLSCWRGAYQQGQLVLRVPRNAPARAVPVSLPRPPGAPAPERAEDAAVVSEGDYAADTAILSSASKGRGIGDCGYAAQWAFDGKGFVPASYDYQRRCAGAPGDWLPLYRARVEKER